MVCRDGEERGERVGERDGQKMVIMIRRTWLMGFEGPAMFLRGSGTEGSAGWYRQGYNMLCWVWWV